MNAPANGCRVLIVEPEPMVSRILAHKLRREGHEVVCCGDVDSASMVFDAADIALVDTALPDAATLAARGRQLSCGWLAICESRDDGAARAAVRDGAAGVVRTPFKPTVVAAQVDTLLRLRRQ